MRVKPLQGTDSDVGLATTSFSDSAGAVGVVCNASIGPAALTIAAPGTTPQNCGPTGVDCTAGGDATATCHAGLFCACSERYVCQTDGMSQFGQVCPHGPYVGWRTNLSTNDGLHHLTVAVRGGTTCQLKPVPDNVTAPLPPLTCTCVDDNGNTNRAATSTSVLTISHAFLSSMPPHTRRRMCSPC